MEREYKFRGKNKETGEWEYSNTINWSEWDLKTVCEFTGLVDSGGLEIYEHDYLEVYNDYNGLVNHKWDGEVVFCRGSFYVRRFDFDKANDNTVYINHRHYLLNRYIQVKNSEGLPESNVFCGIVVGNCFDPKEKGEENDNKK